MKRVLLLSIVASVALLWLSDTAEACRRRACVVCPTVACCDPCADPCDPCATSVSYFPTTRFYRTGYWGYRSFYRPAFTFTGYRGRFVSYGTSCCW